MDKQMCYIHRMKYYGAIKRNTELIHMTMTTWLNLEMIMLSKMSQIKRAQVI